MTIKGVALVKAKLKAGHEWENPTNFKNIWSFLEFPKNYHRSVQHYVSTVSALTTLSKKDVMWHWCPLENRAFEILKTALCITSLLIYLGPSIPYTIVSDTFGDAA